MGVDLKFKKYLRVGSNEITNLLQLGKHNFLLSHCLSCCRSYRWEQHVLLTALQVYLIFRIIKTKLLFPICLNFSLNNRSFVALIIEILCKIFISLNKAPFTLRIEIAVE